MSIKIDMEKGEGLELRKTFEVTAYPTMFVFDAKGNVLTKVLVAMDGTKLLERVQNKQAVL